MRLSNFLLGALLLPAALTAQEQNPRLVQPERPTVATHAHTVAPGYIELEAGVQGDAVANQRSWSAPLVTKIGVAEHLQLNLYTPLFFSNDLRPASGLGDLAVGLKWRILDDHPVLGDFALLPIYKFPSASEARGLGSGDPDATLIVISSHDLNGVSMDLNVAVTRASIGTSNATTSALWTASFGFPVQGKLGWVAEVFGLPAIDGAPSSPSVMLLTGPTFLVSTALAADLGIIARVHGDMPTSVYAGLVWNLGRLWPSTRAASMRRN